VNANQRLLYINACPRIVSAELALPHNKSAHSFVQHLRFDGKVAFYAIVVFMTFLLLRFE
jgi:hypothetical protein